MREERDLYNDKLEKTGLTYFKGDKIPEGYYPTVVMIAPQNSENKFLMQQFKTLLHLCSRFRF